MLTWEKDEARKKFKAAFRKKTLRELLHPDHLKMWLFPGGEEKFYYCHVNLDWFEVHQTPPDVYSMAYETGLNLVGINVALNVYTQMLNSGQWVYFLPHYYWTFNCPDKYHDQQVAVFDIFAQLMGLIAEDLYIAGYEISRAGGGLGVYIPMISDQLEQVSLAEVQGVEILNKLYKSKEFSFIEYYGNDPTYGSLLFNNVAYKRDNTNFSQNPNEWFGVNQNAFNPQRFERWMSAFIDKIYNEDVDDFTISSEFGILTKDLEHDTLTINQSSVTDITSDPIRDITTVRGIVDGINFSYSIYETRERNNLLLTYINKAVGDTTGAVITKKWLIIGEDKLEHFFRAYSWFIMQPLITNYLYSVYMIETSIRQTMNKQLYPSFLTKTTQLPFITQMRENFAYGDPLRTSLPGYLKSKLTNIQSGTSGSDYVEQCTGCI